MPHGLYLQGCHSSLLIEDQSLHCFFSTGDGVGVDFLGHELLSAVNALFHFLHGLFHLLLDELLILLLLFLRLFVEYLFRQQAVVVVLVI